MEKIFSQDVKLFRIYTLLLLINYPSPSQKNTEVNSLCNQLFERHKSFVINK